MCRDRIRKAKAQVELNLVGDVKNNKKGFNRCTSRRQAKECVPPLINEDRELASSNMGKAEVRNESFALLLTAGQAPPKATPAELGSGTVPHDVSPLGLEEENGAAGLGAL